ncbi:hypothetical protein QYF61_018866 [Mycteria americana]|uniref:Uncharacterized protein n=1 Tax=Mycteria americana TaxID=33587 RepID=A0AAN7SIP1_MYCAM|nr:hypothetical protein QYF61_018866 [Mycteria americana]
MAIQPVPYPSNSPTIKPKSLQFSSKNVVGDHIKDYWHGSTGAAETLSSPSLCLPAWLGAVRQRQPAHLNTSVLGQGRAGDRKWCFQKHRSYFPEALTSSSAISIILSTGLKFSSAASPDRACSGPITTSIK